MSAPFLPAAVPLGSLADYQETILGQWQQVITPDSSHPVLEVPQASQMVQPTGQEHVYYQYDPGCDLALVCTCVAHEVNTDTFLQVGGADFTNNPSEPFSCPEWAQGPGNCQGGADALQGLPLGSTFAPWFLNLFGLNPNTPMQIDYWTLVCDPIIITLLNWKPRVPITIPPPPPPPPGCRPMAYWPCCCVR